MKSHHKLVVWQEAMLLVEDIYELTKSFPKDELYGLTSQMRRSVISIPSNISEGAARNSHKEFMQFLFIARASLSELETQLLIAKRLGYTDDISGIQERVEKVFALISGLIKSQSEK